MARIIDHEQHRNALLDGAVKAGAKFDLGGITNETIAEMSGQSEPYIYRYFLDRDDLIRKAFFRCDANFFDELSKNVPILMDKSQTPKERLKNFLDASWDFWTDDYDYCKFYIRYYYSNANTAEFRNEHKRICAKFYDKIAPLFAEEMNVDKTMHQVFSVVIWNIMDMAIGITENTTENKKHLFDAVYGIVSPFFKPYEKVC